MALSAKYFDPSFVDMYLRPPAAGVRAFQNFSSIVGSRGRYVNRFDAGSNPMFEFKKAAVAIVPVRLIGSDGSAQAGVVYTSVTANVYKSDGTTSSISVGSTDWAELTSGAFASAGCYTLKLPSSALSVEGALTYAVSFLGAETYIGVIDVVANLEADTYSRVGAPTGASISADVAAVKTDTGNLRTDYTTARAAKIDNLDATVSSRAASSSITTLTGDVTALSSDVADTADMVLLVQKLMTGRKKLSALDNTLKIYDPDDNTTVLVDFNCLDGDGVPSITTVLETVPA